MMLAGSQFRSFLLLGALFLMLSGSMRAASTEEPMVKDPFAKLDAMPLSWVREELMKIEVPLVLPRELNREEILKEWCVLKRHADKNRSEECLRVEEYYVKYLYPQTPPKQGAAVDVSQNLELMKNLLEALFKAMTWCIEMRKTKLFDELLTTLAPDNESLSQMDRKLSALQAAYRRFYYAPDTLWSFGDFIKTKLAVRRDADIARVYCPPGPRSLHFPTNWVDILRGYLGTGAEYNYNLSPLCEAEIMSFFLYFSPLDVIEEMKREINESKNKEELSGAAKFLMDEIEATENVSWEEESAYAYRRELFEFEDALKLRTMDPKSIKTKGVERLLVKIGVLRRNSES